MSELGLDDAVIRLANDNARKLEDLLDADVILYSGIIVPSFVRAFRNFLEGVQGRSKRKGRRLAIVLKTGGGSVETVERYVDIARHLYDDISFVVPDAAMSAGTVWCMSGDRIYMDYSSCLGPIDPQVPAPGTQEFIPAQGYLEKVKELSEKSELTEADVVMLRGIDLARLSLYEQARELSLDLLKGWLVRYKFKDWKKHSDGERTVTKAEKEERAEEIARTLSDNSVWHSHGRAIDVERLQILRLKVEDYSRKQGLRQCIRGYHDVLVVYGQRMGRLLTLHHHSINMEDSGT